MRIRGRPSDPPIVRFWLHVNKTETCWLWTGGKSPSGYGIFGVGNGKTNNAHRWLYAFTYGPIPPRMDVCHHCDTPACVRPDHMFLGTRRDNMQDAKAKGRTRGNNPKGKNAGATNGMAKLTPEQVREIKQRRAAGEKGVHLARAFGVSPAAISSITTGLRWQSADLT